MDRYQDIIKQLEKRNPQAIILYGSYAWGKPHQDSDLDLLVIEKSSKSRIDRIRELRSYLQTSQPVDIMGLTLSEVKKYGKYSFYKKILTEGKIVYGRI
jgi:predicted nucleotidyltransferase